MGHNPDTLQNQSDPVSLSCLTTQTLLWLLRCSDHVSPYAMISICKSQNIKRANLQKTYLEYFKSIDIQHANIKLLMNLHDGFVDGLKQKKSFVTFGHLWRERTRYYSKGQQVMEKECPFIPLLGSQKHVSAGPWTGRPVCNTPAPHSVSRRWTPWNCPTYCPSSCWSTSPSAASGQSPAETQGRPELQRERDKREWRKRHSTDVAHTLLMKQNTSTFWICWIQWNKGFNSKTEYNQVWWWLIAPSSLS